jgi:hypothetical protein
MKVDANRIVDTFITNYYRTRDKSRISEYYNQNTKIVWNGNPMNGLQFLSLSPRPSKLLNSL